MVGGRLEEIDRILLALGREGAALASEHDGADLLVILQFGEDADDFGAERPGECVQRIGPVQRDEGNGAVALLLETDAVAAPSRPPVARLLGFGLASNQAGPGRMVIAAQAPASASIG